MTGLLRDLMHERADALPDPALDVDLLVRTAQRRVSRRRTSLIGGAAVVAVVAGVLTPLTLRGDDDGRRAIDDPIATAFGDHRPTYAVGSTVHIDGQSFDVRRRVLAFVQTDLGVVVSDVTGVISSSDGTTTVEVGRTDPERVRIQGDGTMVAWVEWEGDTPTFAALDLSTGEVTRDPLEATPGMGALADEQDPAYVYAVDAPRVYVRDSRGLVAWDVVSGEQQVLDPDVRNGFDVADVAGGLFAYQVAGGDQTFRVGPSLSEGVTIPGYPGNNSSLSPDGRWLLVEDTDQNIVYDTATGTAQPFDQGDYFFLVGYEWTGPDTYAALGLPTRDESEPIDLLTCSVVSGSCDLEVPAAGTIQDGFILPFGEPFG